MMREDKLSPCPSCYQDEINAWLELRSRLEFQLEQLNAMENLMEVAEEAGDASESSASEASEEEEAMVDVHGERLYYSPPSS